MTNSEKRTQKTGLAFISPWLIGFALFTAYPIAASLWYSLCEYRVLSPPKFVGLRNYTELFADKDSFLPSLSNTAYMFLAIPLATVMAVGVALLLNSRVKGMAAFRAVYYLPSVVPTVAGAMLWMWMLNPEHGLVNKGLAAVGLHGPEWLQSAQWSKPALIMMDLWTVGSSVVIYLAALQGVPHHLYEAAEIDGAGPWRRTWHITLPSISPVIFFNLVLAVIGTFQYFTQPWLVTSVPPSQPGQPANSTLFYSIYLFQNAFSFFRMGYACAMAFVLFLLTMLATLVVFKTSAKWVYYESAR
jgi:multiple sugar transport system permease protein